MAKKQQFSFKISNEVLSDFDEVLHEFEIVTGIKPVRQNSIEMAMKDYITKLKKQIEALKLNKE